MVDFTRSEQERIDAGLPLQGIVKLNPVKVAQDGRFWALDRPVQKEVFSKIADGFRDLDEETQNIVLNKLNTKFENSLMLPNAQLSAVKPTFLQNVADITKGAVGGVVKGLTATTTTTNPFDPRNPLDPSFPSGRMAQNLTQVATAIPLNILGTLTTGGAFPAAYQAAQASNMGSEAYSNALRAQQYNAARNIQNASISAPLLGALSGFATAKIPGFLGGSTATRATTGAALGYGQDIVGNFVNQYATTGKIDPNTVNKMPGLGTLLGAGVGAVSGKSLTSVDLPGSLSNARKILVGLFKKQKQQELTTAEAGTQEVEQFKQAAQQVAQTGKTIEQIEQEAQQLLDFVLNLKSAGRQKAASKVLEQVAEAASKGDETAKRVIEKYSQTRKKSGKGKAETDSEVEVNEKKFVRNIHGSPKSRMGNKKLNFESDVDHALYIVANAKSQSAAHDKYMNFLREVFPSLTDVEIKQLATKVKTKVIANANQGGDVVDIPKTFDKEINVSNPKAQESTGKTKPKKKPKKTNKGKPEQESISESEGGKDTNESQSENKEARKSKPKPVNTTKKLAKESKPEYYVKAQTQKTGRFRTLEEIQDDPIFKEAYENLTPEQKQAVLEFDKASRNNKKLLGNFYNPKGGVRRSSFETELYTPLGLRAAVKDGSAQIYFDGYNENAQFSTRLASQVEGQLKQTKYEGYEGLYHNPNYSPKEFDPANALYENIVNPILKKQALNKTIDPQDFKNAADNAKKAISDMLENGVDPQDNLRRALERMPVKVKDEFAKKFKDPC